MAGRVVRNPFDLPHSITHRVGLRVGVEWVMPSTLFGAPSIGLALLADIRHRNGLARKALAFARLSFAAFDLLRSTTHGVGLGLVM